MTPQAARFFFPKILPHLIRIQMTNLALPWAILAVSVDAYQKTLAEVLQCE